MNRSRWHWTNPLTRMKVKQQLVLLFLILVSPVFLLNGYANLKAEQILKRHVTNAYAELNKQNFILINRDIDTISRIMNTIIQNPVTQALQPGEDEIFVRVRKYETADSLLATYPIGVSAGEAVSYFLYIYDPKGDYDFAPDTPPARYRNGGVYFYNDATMQDWMRAAAERKGKGFLQVFEGGMVPGLPNQRTLAYIRAVNSTTQGNRVIGVLIAINVDKRLQQSMATVSLPDQGELYLTDYGNRILASTVAPIGETLRLPDDLVTADEPDGSADAIASGYIYVQHYNYEAQQKLIYKIPTFSMLQQQNELKRVIQLISLVYSVFAMAVMAYFWRSLLTPMARLAAFTRTYEPGRAVPRKQTEDRNDEVGVLIRSVHGMAQRLNALIEDRYVMEIKQKEAQLQLLYQQINPHLLYNTLESIYWKSTLEGHSESAEMIKELAQLMRIGLSRGRELITLREELEHARAYMNLQQMRYDYEFRLTWEIAEETLDTPIPKISLQPLLENAIHHGVRNMGEDGEIAVAAMTKGDRVVIRIADNGYAPVDYGRIGRILEGEPSEAPAGYGIRNVQQRMRMHFGAGFGLAYGPREDGGGTAVTIAIPAGAGSNDYDNEEARHVQHSDRG